MKTVQIKIPTWLTMKLLAAIVLIVCAGVGCFYWGMSSVDVDNEIETYLLAESQEMQMGRNAGYTIMLVGNETTSAAWIAFCDDIIEGCIEILQGGQNEG